MPQQGQDERQVDLVMPRDADALSTTLQTVRKLVGMLTFRLEHPSGGDASLTPAEVIQRVRKLKAEAQANQNLAAKRRAIWSLESLGFAFACPPDSTNRLDLPQLDASVLPILHVGAGSQLVESLGFDAARIRNGIEQIAHTDYTQFPFETVGAMLAQHTEVPKLIRSLLGLRHLRAPADRASYLAQFDPETRRVMSHGYGRMMYFSRLTLVESVADVVKRNYLNHYAAIQGVAFAYTIVNLKDALKLLHILDRLRGTVIGEPFREGVVYALVWVEWTIPGSLDELIRKPELTAFQRTIQDLAQANVREFLHLGRIQCFRLATLVS